jgi:hypothetical protein
MAKPKPKSSSVGSFPFGANVKPRRRKPKGGGS